jgi:hypothetical protein
MNPIRPLDHLNGRHMRTHPSRKFPTEPLLEKLTKGAGSDSRWSRVGTVDETRPESEDPCEGPERRYHWYRPGLVG